MALTAGEWRQQLASWLAANELEHLLPEVAALRGIPQPPEFHPEGDVYTHTMLAIAAIDEDDDERIFWGVLLHDIGKPATTTYHNGRWRAHGHAEAGAGLVRAVMERFGLVGLTEDITWLVRYHHFRHSWNLAPGDGPTRRQQKFMAHPLFPLLERVCAADAAGRGMFRADRTVFFGECVI